MARYPFPGVAGVALGTALWASTGVNAQAVAPAAQPPAPAAAPATPAAAASGVEDILVTARRRSERLQDVPVAINAVDKKMLQTYALNDISSVSKMTPQLKVSVGGPSGGAQLYLRGIGSTANTGFDPAVGLVIDGVFYNRTIWLTQSFVDMQAVEVLKGPQSLYFGKNTPAGVVMVETANPTIHPEFGIKTGYEFAARERFVEAYASGPITDTLGVRLVGRYSDMDGWIKVEGATRQAGDPQNLTLPAPSNSRLPGTRDRTGRLTLKWDPSSRFTATFKASGTHYTDDGPDGLVQIFSCHGPNGTPQLQFGIAAPYDDCKPSNEVGRQDFPANIVATTPGFKKGSKPFSEYNSYAFSLNAAYTLDWANINSVTGYNRYRVQNAADTSYSGTMAYLSTENTVNKAFSQELRLLTTFHGPLNFLVGGFYQHTELDSLLGARITTAAPDPATGNWLTFISPSAQTGQSYSGFAEATWKITPKLELAGGARYTHESKDTSKYNSYINANNKALMSPALFAATTTSHNVSPQATLSWRPNRNLTLYGAYKQGFKAGGFSISSILTAGTRLNQLVFGPEKARGFEIGAKTALLDRRLHLDVNLYDYLYADLQVTAFDAATTAFTIQNAARARVKGIEANASFQFTPEFQIHSDVAYNHARFEDFLGQCYAGQTIQMGCNQQPSPITGIPTSQDLSGKRPPLAPDWNINLGFTWRKDRVFGDKGLQFTVDGHYSSRYPIDATNRPDDFQDKYITLDASVQLFRADERWTLALIGRNLTNQAIILTGADRPGTGGPSGLDQSNPLAGRLADGRGTIDRTRSVLLQASTKF